jgi:diguanylate cyclase (GGDEF)-like protein
MAFFSILPQGDSPQALRLKRFVLAATSALMVVAFMALLYSGGYMALEGLTWSITGIVTCIVVFYGMLRSGLNLRFRDPSMTSIQMASAMLVITSTAFFINSDARDTVVPILLMIFYFGIYRLDPYAMTRLALINIAFYGAMIAALYVYRPQALDLRLELLRWGILALVSLWFGTVGGHVTQLRRGLAERKAAVEALLERDDLTGVGNRRFLTHMLEQEKSRAQRSGTIFCVAMLDLDYFKKVNDTYGHAAGDRILKVFAQAAQQGLRNIDYFGRYGGEEFMLIMSDTRLDGAQATAERLRTNVENVRFNDIDPKLIQTVSIGLAEFHPGESIDHVQLRADKAMYKAKARGRNRIEIDTEPIKDPAAIERSSSFA